jgi:hypothetical protein
VTAVARGDCGGNASAAGGVATRGDRHHGSVSTAGGLSDSGSGKRGQWPAGVADLFSRLLRSCH